MLDTNAIVALIKGNSTILELTAHADFVYLSVINIIEFLSFTNLPENDRILFQEFIQETELLNLSAENTSLINSVCNLRKLHRLKLPDAIIDAQAIYNKATIITADKHLMELIT